MNLLSNTLLLPLGTSLSVCIYAILTVQCSAPFQTLMQNCLVALSLTYCLIYLDKLIVFSRTKEVSLYCLDVVFECFWEHNLKLKPTKCKFFKSETSYLAHHVSKEGVKPSRENLKALAEFTGPKTFMVIWAFWGWWGITDDLLRGWSALLSCCMNIYLGKVPVRRMSK